MLQLAIILINQLMQISTGISLTLFFHLIKKKIKPLKKLFKLVRYLRTAVTHLLDIIICHGYIISLYLHQY